MTPKRKSAQKSANTKTKKLRAQVDSPQPVFPVVPAAASTGGSEALRESEERTRLFQGILRSASDGILAVSRENQVLFSNERFAEMWMIPQEIMASKNDTLLLQFVLDQLTNPQDFLNKVQDLYQSNKRSFDTLYFKDGRVFDRLSRPILEGTEVRGRVWSFHDVSLQRKIEKELAASEAELRALFASMHDTMLVIDRQGVYRKIAPTNPGLLVKPPEELLGMNLRDIFPAEKAVLFGGIVQQVLDTKQTAQIEYDLIIAGRTAWFQTTISALDEDSTLWVAHDITNRKQAEEALRAAEANYRSIFEHATVGIYQSTPQGCFRSVNPLMARIFGYDSPEDMLSSITSIERQYYANPADRYRFQRLMMEEGQAPEFITQNLRKDGSRIWIQEDARAVKDANGNILYYEGFVSDISERRKAEQELRFVKEGLEIVNIELQQSLERESLLANTDGLTGLYNYRHFFELAAREFSVAVRYKTPLTFLMFDMDDFKQVNDILGHTAGDKLLVEVAQTSSAQLRGADVLARYGGDEFIVMLPNASARQALPVAERIRESAAAIRVENGKEPLTIALSIGIAEMRIEPADKNVEHVIQRADKALYTAKRGGRNRTVIFGEDEKGAT